MTSQLDKRAVRGVRKPIAPGYLVGRRVSGGKGAAQEISFFELAQFVASSGVIGPMIANPGFVSADLSASGAVTLISGVPQNVLNVLLGIGTWDITGALTFEPSGAATFTDAIVAFSLVTQTIPPAPNGGGRTEHTGSLSVSSNTTLQCGPMRVTVNTPSPLWMVAQATYT